jgi:polyisoprenoid-binding protein YceI
MGPIIAAQVASGSYLEAYPKIGNGHFLYDLDFVHCTVGFTISHMGWSKVSGTFSKFSGAVVYDDANPQSLDVSFAIDINSINTNQEWRDKDLNSEKWFHSIKYPHIVFQSKRTALRTDGLDLVGDLKMKGTTKEITLHLEPPSGYFKSYVGHELAFNGSTRVNRKDFKIGENTWWNDMIEGIAQLDDSVDIQLSIIYQLQSPEFIKSRFFDNENSIYLSAVTRGAEAGIKEFDRQKTAYDLIENKNEDDFEAITPKDLSTVGLALILEGRAPLAKALLEHNASIYPNDQQALMPLALFHLRQKEYTHARKLTEKTLKLNPDNPWAMEITRQLILLDSPP